MNFILRGTLEKYECHTRLPEESSFWQCRILHGDTIVIASYQLVMVNTLNCSLQYKTIEDMQWHALP